MTRKRTTVIGIRMDLNLLDDIEKIVKAHDNPKGVFPNTSEAIRECTKVGIQVHNYQEMMKDPEKAEEFRQKMEEILKNEEIDMWADTLTTQQLEGFSMFVKLKLDSRHKVSKFV